MTFAVVKPVPRRDFFSFCTTLRPIELKALGELSHVRHLQKGELIYTTGELAEEIYSVNRGVVEVIKLIPGESDERSFVTRGIFSVSPTLLAKCRAYVRRGPRKSSACNVSIVRISSRFRNGSRRFSCSCASKWRLDSIRCVQETDRADLRN